MYYGIEQVYHHEYISSKYTTAMVTYEREWIALLFLCANAIRMYVSDDIASTTTESRKCAYPTLTLPQMCCLCRRKLQFSEKKCSIPPSLTVFGVKIENTSGCTAVMHTKHFLKNFIPLMLMPKVEALTFWCLIHWDLYGVGFRHTTCCNIFKNESLESYKIPEKLLLQKVYVLQHSSM